MGTRFADKVVLITGAASGIGRAAALAFGAEGARVMVADLDPKGGQQTVDQVLAAGGVAAFVPVDVSDDAQVKAMVELTVATFGRLDVAFNNAGIDAHGLHLTELPIETFDRTIAVNLRGVFSCLRHEIPVMVAQGGGAIINTSSIGGVQTAPGLSGYIAAKHGVVGLTRSAAIEYAKAGVRVNAVLPGAVRTPLLDDWMTAPGVEQAIAAQHPIGRISEPAEIARVVMFLASDDASFVVGHPLLVDGGVHCI